VKHVPDTKELMHDLAASDLEHDQRRSFHLFYERLGDFHDLACGRLAVEQCHDVDQGLGASNLDGHVFAAITLEVTFRIFKYAWFAGFQASQAIEQRRWRWSIAEYGEYCFSILAPS
jgi:hypothetical protein